MKFTKYVCMCPSTSFSVPAGGVWVFGISGLELLAALPQRVRRRLMSSYNMCEGTLYPV